MGQFPMQVLRSARPDESLLYLLSSLPQSVSRALAGLDDFWVSVAAVTDGVTASLPSTSQG